MTCPSHTFDLITLALFGDRYTFHALCRKRNCKEQKKIAFKICFRKIRSISEKFGSEGENESSNFMFVVVCHAEIQGYCFLFLKLNIESSLA